MDWNRLFAHLSNLITIICITLIVGGVIFFVPQAEWAGNVVSAGLAGMIGYLKGIGAGK